MSLSLQHWIQRNRFSSRFRLTSHDSRESSWQQKGSKFTTSSSDMKLLQPHTSAAMAHDIGRPHHCLPQQLGKKTTNHSWKKEVSRSWKRWPEKFSTRPNFHIICSDLHGGRTEGWELSPGGAHGEHLETSLSAPARTLPAPVAPEKQRVSSLRNILSLEHSPSQPECKMRCNSLFHLKG